MLARPKLRNYDLRCPLHLFIYHRRPHQTALDRKTERNAREDYLPTYSCFSALVRARMNDKAHCISQL